MADQIKMRVFSPRTLASQRERQRQSELRKRGAERRGRRRGQRGEVEGGYSGGDIQGVYTEKIMGVTVQICERMGAKLSFLRENRRKKSFCFSKLG